MTLGDLQLLVLEPISREKGWLPEQLPEELQNQGIIGYREIEDGRILTVMPLTFDRALLCLGNGPNATITHKLPGDEDYTVPVGYDGGFDEYRDYDSVELACEAMLRWNGGWEK